MKTSLCKLLPSLFPKNILLAYIIAKQNQYSQKRMVSVNLVNLLLQRPMASNISEAMRGGGAAGQACFVKFYFLRNRAFHCFPAAYNRHDKEIVELQVQKCEVIPSEENLVRYLK